MYCLSLTNPTTTTTTMSTEEHDAAANHGRPEGVLACGRLSRCALIFPLLALSGLIFLLRNVLILEVSFAVCVCVLQSEISCNTTIP